MLRRVPKAAAIQREPEAMLRWKSQEPRILHLVARVFSIADDDALFFVNMVDPIFLIFELAGLTGHYSNTQYSVLYLAYMSAFSKN